MKNYADKTDEDINIEVAEVLGVNWWLPPSKSLSGGWEYCNVPELMTKQDCELPNYCNSWADAGPVIEKNRISIEFDLDDQNTATAFNKHYPGWYEKNPLRAAMIVFLMMKDADK